MIVEYSIFQPLRQVRFRQLWTANLLSNLGAWGQTLAITWHLASLSESVILTSLMQSLTFLPILIFAIPAGMVADAKHKARVLLFSNLFGCITALVLGLLTLADTASSTMLLGFAFVVGVGNAFMLPAWQALMSELVDSKQMIAVASLNNLSFNLAAFLGPFLGGFIYLRCGPAALYLFNAISFLGLIGIYYLWSPPTRSNVVQKLTEQAEKSSSQSGIFLIAIGRLNFRLLLISAFVIFCITTAFAALLPSLIRSIVDANASDFGNRMAALGAGAVFASLTLSRWRKNLSERVLLIVSLSVFGSMFIALRFRNQLFEHLILIVCGGFAWSVIVTSLNAAALRAFPPYMRARCLALYIVFCAAGQAVGGALWGQLAMLFGVLPTLLVAGISMYLSALWIFVNPNFLEEK
jgi:MFS family permease